MGKSNKRRHYRAVFISDIHLGSRNSNVKSLLEFLRHTTADEWYLVGDVIDGWKVIEKAWYWNDDHSQVLRALLKLSIESRVIYTPGNHDEFLRGLVSDGFSLDSVTICDDIVYESLGGATFLVTHGDLYDSVVSAKWLSFLGDRAYDLLVAMNGLISQVRRMFGLRSRWSLSAYAKSKIKAAVSFIGDFEGRLAAAAHARGLDGVICGHIHTAAIKTLRGSVRYMNTGDWVESCTALVETVEGEFKIIEWGQQS